MKTSLLLVVSVLSGLVAVGQARAETQVVPGHVSSFSLLGSWNVEYFEAGPVGLFDDGNGEPFYQGFYVFQLPAVPAGQTPVVRSASLTFDLVEVMGHPWFNVDLYGMPGTRDSADLDFNDFDFDVSADAYAGPTQLLRDRPDDRQDRLIQQAIIAAEMVSADGQITPGPIQTSAAASDALAAYLTSLYEEGDVSGRYALFRLNPDQLPPEEPDFEPVVFMIGFPDGSGGLGGKSALDPLPQLSIEFVPEPGSLLAVGVAAVLLTGRRRR